MYRHASALQGLVYLVGGKLGTDAEFIAEDQQGLDKYALDR